jgi:hypothetical protein
LAVPRFRLYVDESGDHTYNHLSDPARRYLGLTGVAIEDQYYKARFEPALEALKAKHFPGHTSKPVVLVRREIIDRKGPFGVLTDPAKRSAWDSDLLLFLKSTQFMLFTVVIDKQDHLASYGPRANHPYHYCLAVLMERLRGWLKYRAAVADVLVEARGTKENRLLAAEYDSIWNRGTWFHAPDEFQEVLTSKQLKLQPKAANIGGLQLADLVAAPSKHDVLGRHGRSLTAPPTPYTQALINAFSSKYNAYGRVLLSGRAPVK